MLEQFNTRELTVNELKETCLNAPSWEYVDKLKLDGRKSAAQLADRVAKILREKESNYRRICDLIENQQQICTELKSQQPIGVDEVGRGPLAGPVVACAVMLPSDNINKLEIFKLDDSKKLSVAEREDTYYKLINKVRYGIGIIDVQTIDKININNAVDLAMEKAVNNLSSSFDLALVDGHRLPRGLDEKGEAVAGGDGKFANISAASIIAKVFRDKIMDQLHYNFPKYNFRSNKGYGTGEHVQAIKINGSTPVHRQSYLTNIARG